MAKEIYLYSPVYDFVAEEVITQMEENSASDISIRINSPGGSVFAGWGIIAKIKEATNKVSAKVDGFAASMATYILLFIKDVEALEVTKFVLHRADMYVSTPDDQAFLDSINKDLRAAMKSKLDLDKLKEIKGITLDDIFNPDTRLDVLLTAKEAKQIGLINKINKVNTADVKALTERFYHVAANVEDPTLKTNPMTIEKLKAEFPTVYAAIIAEGTKEGTTKERSRVKAFLGFAEIDPKAVKEAIEKGDEMTIDVMADFTSKSLSKGILAKIKTDSPDAVVTEEAKAEQTEKEKKNADFLGAVNANLGIKETVKA